MTELRPDPEYLEHLAAGRFMIQRSRGSGRHVFYPRVAEPGTGARDLEWVLASGKGVVYATTVVRVKPPAPSYNVAIVELEEGPRMLSRVEGLPPEQVTIGQRVRARIVAGEAPYIVFDPAP
jgi:uncharacterized protein